MEQRVKDAYQMVQGVSCNLKHLRATLSTRDLSYIMEKVPGGGTALKQRDLT